MSASLDGVRLKIDRAEYHFQQFQLALHAGLPATRVELRSKELDSEGNHIAIGDIFPGEAPPELGLHIGDAVHNLRSSLDHLVCQLAVAAGNRRACDKTQFPIFFNDTPDNRKTIKRRIRGVATSAEAEIESLQPYKRRPLDPTADLLWLLSELDNIDKHRLLLVVNPKFAAMRLTVTIDGVAKSYTISDRPEWRPLKLDAMPFRIRIPKDPSKPQTQVQVDANPLTGVVFAKTGLKCDGQAVAPLIREMVADVKTIVDGFVTKKLI